MSEVTTFVSMAILIFLYAYLVGGQASMLMLYMFLLAPAVSAVLTFIIRKNVDIDILIPKTEIEKGGIIRVEVCLRNKSFLPIPFVDIVFNENSNFTLSDSSVIRVSLGPCKGAAVAMDYTARYRGMAEIGVKRIELRGYLGVLRLSLLRNSAKYDNLRQVTVVPQVFSIRTSSRILASSEEAFTASEVTEGNTSAAYGSGEPGYEFREYEPGDALHKIHWKLSAKRDILMVRKDQQPDMKKKYLVLDPCMAVEESVEKEKENFFSKLLYDSDSEEGSEPEEAALIQEKLLETVLSMANTIINTGRECAFCSFEHEKWHKEDITSIKDIARLQHSMAAYEFPCNCERQIQERIPASVLFENWGRGSGISKGEVIIFTADLDKELQSEIRNCLGSGMKIDTVLVQEDSDEEREHVQGSENLWIVNPKGDLTEIF